MLIFVRGSSVPSQTHSSFLLLIYSHHRLGDIEDIREYGETGGANQADTLAMTSKS